MGKHVTDKPHKTSDSARLKRYTGIDRDVLGVRRQTLTLQQRPRDKRNEGRRAAEFARIERGHSA